MTGPLALIAELTHRCPLHCVYCSNPVQMQERAAELTTAQWGDVFREAAALGVMQADFTGGEPLARADLVELVAAARQAGLYINLITSGIGLNENRLQALVAAGVDHIQLSFQDVNKAGADEIAGARAHAHKLALAKRIRQHHVAFTMNVVVHRQNLERLPQIIALAEELQADKLEIANVQYYGWALENRAALLPSEQQLSESLATVKAAQERLRGRMRIDFVVPDYYGKYPKPCMDGWGRKLMLINPAGEAMPCHAAGVIPGMRFANVTNKPLRWIWEESEAFQRFRGEAWMPEPCRSCERRGQDFGGCRCQALLLAGDASTTDPACSLAPSHHVVATALAQANPAPVAAGDEAARPVMKPSWVYRPNPQ
ncbi:MAG TPA: pyrroloquinoline quinone biosynthesis protein PqqE [Terriglobales bacterium]|nr:pyrroloquinoline quinone biosynthesis protein PqqE [Terriglobales bacterium]